MSYSWFSWANADFFFMLRPWPTLISSQMTPFPWEHLFLAFYLFVFQASSCSRNALLLQWLLCCFQESECHSLTSDPHPLQKFFQWEIWLVDHWLLNILKPIFDTILQCLCDSLFIKFGKFLNSSFFFFNSDFAELIFLIRYVWIEERNLRVSGWLYSVTYQCSINDIFIS